MRKLIALVAMVVMSLTSYAQYVTVDGDGLGCKFTFSNTSPTLSVDTTIAEIIGVYASNTMELVVKKGQVFESHINPYSNSTWDVSFAYDATAELADKTVWKLKSEYIQADGINRGLLFTGVVGDKIVLHVASKGITENTFTLSGCTDDDTTIVMTPKDPILVWVTKTYTMTASAASIYVSQGGYCIDWAYVGANNPVGCKHAIASSLLKKVGNELVNPTNIKVEVYSVMGVRVISCSETNICLSDLAKGTYIARTSQGTLKFFK